jgi:hypothetical protein
MNANKVHPFSDVNANNPAFAKLCKKWPIFRIANSKINAIKITKESEIIDYFIKTLGSEIYEILQEYKAIICGGIFYSLITGQDVTQSDIDVAFTRHSGDSVECAEKIRKILNPTHVYYSNRVVELIGNITMQFAIGKYEKVDDCIAYFDLASCKIMLDCAAGTRGKVYLTEDAIMALQYSVNCISMENASVAFEARIHKYMKRNVGMLCIGLTRNIEKQMTFDDLCFTVIESDGNVHYINDIKVATNRPCISIATSVDEKMAMILDSKEIKKVYGPNVSLADICEKALSLDELTTYFAANIERLKEANPVLLSMSDDDILANLHGIAHSTALNFRKKMPEIKPVDHIRKTTQIKSPKNMTLSEWYGQ